MRAEKLDGRRGGGEGGRGGGREGDGGPHYKFNLTNGSENLETMEYMKCGRVYHDGRHGVVPAAILSGPIHILRERARGWGARGRVSTMEYRRKSDRKGKTHCWHDKKSRDTRTVPVARSNHHVDNPFDSCITWIYPIGRTGVEIRREGFIAPFDGRFFIDDTVENLQLSALNCLYS